MAECSKRGCKYPVWANGLCQMHSPRKPMKSKQKRLPKRRPSKPKSLLQVMKPAQDKFNRRQARIQVFMIIWNNRPHRSEVSGTPLGREPLSTFFHHILPKSKYPEYDLDPENIILLTPEEHENVEADMYKYEVVNVRREALKIKYDL